MKTNTAPPRENPKVVAAAYRTAEQVLWKKLDDYKINAIEECRKNPKRDSHIYDDFVKEVIRLAEQTLDSK